VASTVCLSIFNARAITRRGMGVPSSIMFSFSAQPTPHVSPVDLSVIQHPVGSPVIAQLHIFCSMIILVSPVWVCVFLPGMLPPGSACESLGRDPAASPQAGI